MLEHLVRFLLLIGFYRICTSNVVPVVKIQEIEKISRKDFYMPLNLSPEQIPPDAGHFIAGFTDGEGSFYTSVRRRTDYSTGWKFSLNFNISQNDKVVLHYCQKYLGCGNIRTTRPGKYVLEVEDLELIRRRIIPFYRRFQFRSVKKRREFRVFQLMLRDFLTHGPIVTRPQLNRFLKLRRILGQYREARNINTNEDILNTFVCQLDIRSDPRRPT